MPVYRRGFMKHTCLFLALTHALSLFAMETSNTPQSLQTLCLAFFSKNNLYLEIFQQGLLESYGPVFESIVHQPKAGFKDLIAFSECASFLKQTKGSAISLIEEKRINLQLSDKAQEETSVKGKARYFEHLKHVSSLPALSSSPPRR